MTLNEIAALAGNATFQNQIRSAALAYAHTVIAEAPDVHNQLAEKRYELAALVLQDGCSTSSTLTRMAWGIASVPGFSAVADDTGSQNDAAIASAMISSWDDLALATGAMRTN